MAINKTPPAPEYNYQDNPYNINSTDPSEKSRAISWRNARDASQLRVAGTPVRPDFVPTVDENGVLKDQYQLKSQDIAPDVQNLFQGLTADPRALNALRDQALSTEESPWLKLQTEKQGLDQAHNLDLATQQGAGNAATAESALAMRGGLSSGARERLARSNAWDTMASQQDVRRGGSADRLNLNIADQGMKQDVLKALPGLENQALQPQLQTAQYMGNIMSSDRANDVDTQKYNISQSLNDILQKRAYDLTGYSEQMKAWAADRTGQATENAGKK